MRSGLDGLALVGIVNIVVHIIGSSARPLCEVHFAGTAWSRVIACTWGSFDWLAASPSFVSRVMESVRSAFIKLGGKCQLTQALP